MAELFDYVVVGSGPGGCALASRLTEDPACRVLLLEAGGSDRQTEIHVPAAFSKLFRTPCDWQYETDPQRQLNRRRLYWPRGKMLGGSTSMNAQMYLRGNPADYDAWERAGNRGWAFRDMLGYFRKVERHCLGPSELHGGAGPLRIERLRDPNPGTRTFLRAAAEVDIRPNDDVNGASQEGAGLTHVTQRRGRRWSAADAYLRPILRRPNLRVLTGAHATRVLVEGRRATGVAYVQDGAYATVRAAREVIVAGGSINSPQLLMLSGIGPAQHLRGLGIDVVQDLPGVGRNLLDHVAVALIVNARRPVSLVSAESYGNLLRFLLLRRGMLTSNVAEACAFVRTRPELLGPDLELIFAPVPFIDHGLVKPSAHGFTIGAVAIQPRSAGFIELRSSSAFDPPRIEPNYLSDADGEDVRVLVEGVKLGRRIFASPAFASLAGEEIEPDPEARTDQEIAAAIREQAETLYHPVGTCRMGVDEMAVVDPELRVRGVAALRVVDASVMPTMIRGHTMAPTYAIAEKAADLIRARLAPSLPASEAGDRPTRAGMVDRAQPLQHLVPGDGGGDARLGG